MAVAHSSGLRPVLPQFESDGGNTYHNESHHHPNPETPILPLRLAPLTRFLTREQCSRIARPSPIEHQSEEAQRDLLQINFLKLMRIYEKLCGLCIGSYRLMSNHFHLLVQVPQRPSP